MSLHVVAGAPEQWRPGDVAFELHEVQEVLGAGGMGVVHRVRHRVWGLEMAMKSPRATLLARPGAVDEFLQEADHWVRLGLHPNIACCFYVRLHGGVPHVFSEYVDGGDLRDLAVSRTLYQGESLPRLLDFAVQFARGLAYAHRLGLTHGDVKNANVLVGKNGLLKVTDFGLSRSLLQDESQQGVHRYSAAYASPEQVAGRDLTLHTDIYSWAVSILELFMGHAPKWGPMALFALQDYEKNGSSYEGCPAMPPGLAELLRACLQEDPALRPPDFEGVLEELAAVYEAACLTPYPRPDTIPTELHSDSLNNQGLSLLDLGQLDAAAEKFDAALAASGGHRAARYNKALLDWRRGLLTDDQVLGVVGALELGDWEPCLRLAEIHLERGDADQALTHLRDARRLGAPEELLAPLEGTPLAADERLSLPGLRVAPGCLSLDQKGRFLLTGGQPAAWTVWDLESGRQVASGVAPGRQLLSLAMSADARYLFFGNEAGEVGNQPPRNQPRLPPLKGHVGRITALTLEVGGAIAATASDDKTVRVWSTVTGECFAILPQGGAVQCLAMTMTPSRMVAAGLADGRIHLWAWGREARCTATLTGHSGPVTALAFSRNGQTLLSAGADGTLRSWQVAEGRLQRTVTGHRGAVLAAALSDAEGLVVSGGEDGTVRWWRWPLGQCWRTIPLHSGKVLAVAVAGLVAVAATADGQVKVWDVPASPRPASPMVARPQYAEELIHLQQGYQTLVQSVASAMHELDVPSALEGLARMRQTAGFERSPDYLALCEQLWPYARRGALVGVWPWPGLEAHRHACGITRVALSYDSNCIVSADEAGEVHLVDLGTLALQARVRLGAPVQGLALAYECCLAAAGTQVQVLHVQDGAVLQTLGHRQDVRGLACDRPGRRVLTVSQDGAAAIWAGDPAMAVVWTQPGQGEAVAMQADGSSWMLGTYGGPCRVWRDGQAQSVLLRGPQGAVRAVALSLDGSRAVSAGDDRNVHLWDVGGGRLRRSLSGHTRPLCDVAMSPDGRTVVSAAKDRTVRMWDFDSGQCWRELPAHEAPVTAVALSPDARYLVTGAADGTLRLWYLDWELLAWQDGADLAAAARPWVRAFVGRHPGWSEAHLGELQRDLQLAGLGSVAPQQVKALLMERS